MSGPGVPLQRIAQALQAHYGDPAPPPVTDPLGLILWENVAYLVDDQRRMRAFRALEEHTGLDARDIASAPDEVLLKARRELKRFHGIGVPGAEKILLFTGTEAVQWPQGPGASGPW